MFNLRKEADVNRQSLDKTDLALTSVWADRNCFESDSFSWKPFYPLVYWIKRHCGATHYTVCMKDEGTNAESTLSKLSLKNDDHYNNKIPQTSLNSYVDN